MSGTGEKKHLRQIMNHLHEMLKSLGQQDGTGMTIKIDQFEMLRRDFTNAAQKYEKTNENLPNIADKKQRSIAVFEISQNKRIMETVLKKMVDLNLRANNKLKTKGKIKMDEAAQKEMDYKNLTVYNLQNTFFKLTKAQHKAVKKKQNYPEPQTLQELKMNAPLHPQFSEDEEDLEEKEILEAIKHIDDQIQQKMDFILHGLQMLNYNAVSISEGIQTVHKKILINVENIDKNMEDLHEAEDLLEEASPNVSKPNCIMNVIIVVILAVIVYLIVRKLIPEGADSQDSLPT